MSEQTTTKPKLRSDGRRLRTTSFATSPAGSKRVVPTKRYTLEEVSVLCDVTVHAVRRWENLGYVKGERTPVEGTKRHNVTILGSELTKFFASRKEHAKGVEQRRAERERKSAAKAKAPTKSKGKAPVKTTKPAGKRPTMVSKGKPAPKPKPQPKQEPVTEPDPIEQIA